MQETEYFVHANTFAAPFVSETISKYVTAESPGAAVEQLVASYRDSLPIYAACVYDSADDFHKNRPALATWHSNKALATANAGSIYSESPNGVEIDGEWVDIEDPYSGRLVS